MVSFLYSFDFSVLGVVEQISCVYHGRTKGEEFGHVKTI